MSLPAHNRLCHRRDFSLVYRKGLRCSSRNLTLRVLQCDGGFEEVSSASRSNSRAGLLDSDQTSSGHAGSGCKVVEGSAGDLSGASVDLDQEKTVSHNDGLHRVVTYPGDQGCVTTRFGVSISKKVSKKAVVRNRIKRHLKAAFRQLLPRVTGCWLIVVVVRPSAVQCDYWQFLQELEQTLTSAEVIDGHS